MPGVENFPNTATTSLSITRQTIHVPGIVQMPQAGPPGTPCRFVRTSAPYEVEIITWVATADNGPPAVPAPTDPQITSAPGGLPALNTNMVFLGMTLTPIVPTPIGGGQSGHAWSIGGTYTYGRVLPQFNMSATMTDLPTGSLGFSGEPAMNSPLLRFPGANFVQGMLDPTIPIPPLQAPIQAGG